MIVSRPLAAQAATGSDSGKLAKFVARAGRVHQHLDWHLPSAWLGHRPFYFAMEGRRVAGVFAAPPDPPDAAWVRVLGIADGVPAGDVLRAVWPAARRDLEADGVHLVAALAVDEWVGAALEGVGFLKVNEVVVLARRGGITTAVKQPASYSVRRFGPADLAGVSAVDLEAFDPPWQNSPEALRLGLAQSAWATVAETGHPPRPIGFQISTPSDSGGHLARLAVLPEYRGQGIATALVADAVAYFDRHDASQVTVNTQQDNYASLAIYSRLGFEPTGERYGIWQMRLG